MQIERIDVDGDVDSLLVVSDLHSFIEPLEALDVELASRPGSAQVVVAGDIISGGANPAETVEWVRRNAGDFAVLGNHDEVAILGGEGDHPPYSEAGGGICDLIPDRPSTTDRSRSCSSLHGRGR